MASHGPLLQFALLAGFVLSISLSLLIAAAEHPLRRLLAGKPARQRARISWWMLVSPALAGLAQLLMTLAMPSLLHDSAGFAAACSAHSDRLWHFCVWHPSESGQSAGLWAALALVAAYALWLAVRAACGLWRIRRTLATMLRLSWRPVPSDRFHVVEAEQPLALACGIGRGHILLSSALLERLDPTQLRVVLAHEQAHIGHRDVRYRLIAVLLSSLQLPGTGRRLLRDLALAMEQRCDLAAAETVGSPIKVAETIVAVEKIFRHHAQRRTALSLAFVSDFVPERIESLLSPDPPSLAYLGAALGFCALGFCILSSGWLHATIESLIAMLTR